VGVAEAEEASWPFVASAASVAWAAIAFASLESAVAVAVVAVAAAQRVQQAQDAPLHVEALELAASREDVAGEERDGAGVHMVDTCAVACHTAGHRMGDSNPWVKRASSRPEAPEA
jgi:hypothetical protein